MNCLFQNEALGNNLIRNTSCICRETRGDIVFMEHYTSAGRKMTTNANSSNDSKGNA